jgi:hypothetical protein
MLGGAGSIVDGKPTRGARQPSRVCDPNPRAAGMHFGLDSVE